MTDISTIYNAFVARMGTLYTAHNRLTNVQDLAQNNEQFLTLGWGIQVGAGTNTERSVSRISTVSREFIFHFTRKVYARELDPSGKADAEKSLLEDLQILVDDLERDFTTTTADYVIKYLSDTGILPVQTDKDRFISISATVSAEYFRNL